MAISIKVCEGSGVPAENSSYSTHDGIKRALCPACGVRQAVTRYGNIRKHDDIDTQERKAEKRGEPDPVRIPTVLEMRTRARELKADLQANLAATQDARFRRLWEHAHALETHLTTLHTQRSMLSSAAQLKAYKERVNA